MNELTGPIPDGLADATGLTDLRLNNNQLVGQVPPGLSKLGITTAFLYGNYFSGQMPSFPTGVNVTLDDTDFCAADGSPCSVQVTALLQFLKEAGYSEKLSQTWIGSNPCLTWTGITCSGTDVVSMSLASQVLTLFWQHAMILKQYGNHVF